MGATAAYVTKVIKKFCRWPIVAGLLASALLCGCWAQANQSTSNRTHAAENLYLQLRSVGLDKSRVYKARDVSFDSGGFHITLDDGTIAFTEDVMGRVTGAFFEGDGEVLLIPPDQVERASMALLTGAAILEERFVTAYFRFNDDTFARLQPTLIPIEDAQGFVSQWNETARNLAQADALRLLLSFSRFLPASSDPKPNSQGDESDRVLHARLQGRKLGIFDLYYDGDADEQVWAGQLKSVGGVNYYDVWTSFALRASGGRSEDASGIIGQEAKSRSVTISQYKIQARVDPPTQLNADATLEVEIKQDGDRALLFELSRFLRIKSVDADGEPVEYIHNQAVEGTQLARRGNDLVAVIFSKPLTDGQKIKLHFVYGGEVLSEAGGGLLYVGARGTWYPNRGLGMSNYDLEFRYPPGWVLVATGKQIDSSRPNSTSNQIAGEQVSRWVSERSIPLAGFNLGKYLRVSARAGEVAVDTYAASSVEKSFPTGTEAAEIPQPLIPSGLRPKPETVIVTTPAPSPARNAQNVADASARAIEFFSRRFGPYPYSALALTQMPGDVSQGWPGLIFLSSFSFLTPKEKSDLHMTPVEKTLSNNVIAHETAHQWWGDLVTWSGYRDQWIVEALANYSSLMLLESEDPAAFHAAMQRYRDDLLAKNKAGEPLMDAGPVTLGARLSSSHFPGGYEVISYGRGTWLFHMLRCMMRDAEAKTGRASARSQSAGADEPFVRALRRLRERYEGKAISTHELLRVFEDELPRPLWYEGKRSLDWFYLGWLQGRAIPRLELRGMKYIDKGGSTAVSGTILQKDGPEALVTAVPVYAVSGGRLILLARVFADGPETSFHLTPPAGTRRVVLDPYQTVLSRAR
jgi:peptidase M1-like protein